MKYLVLLLALFMVSNVNAEETYKDVYRSLSYQEKEAYLKLCRLEDFPINTSNDEKGNICLFAYFYTLEKMNKEYNPKIKFQLFEEHMRYLVKAGNFYYLINRNNDLDKVINYMYNTKCHTLTNDRIEKFCNIIKRYKGLTLERKREPLDFSLSDLPLSNNTEDVGTLPYDKYRTDYGRDPFSDESLYVLSMYVAEFIGMAIPWVILFFVLRKYIFYKPKRAEKKNTYNSDTNVEQTSPTNANEVNDVSKPPQEQTHVFNKGVRKNIKKYHS